jgi:hypothetical protein
MKSMFSLMVVAVERVINRSCRICIVVAGLVLVCGTDAAFAQGSGGYEVGLDAYGSAVGSLGGMGVYLGRFEGNYMFAWRASCLADETSDDCAITSGPAFEYTLFRNTRGPIKPTVGVSIEGITESGKLKNPHKSQLVQSFNRQGMLTAGVRILIHRSFNSVSISLKVLAFSGGLYGKDQVPDLRTKGIVLGVTIG